MGVEILHYISQRDDVDGKPRNCILTSFSGGIFLFWTSSQVQYIVKFVNERQEIM